ncbi:MAG: hypothetical protein K6G55_02290 [Selenomonadaceae bacterium]|nr:hypothetical protein [Selenomonadaceae bacterium]
MKKFLVTLMALMMMSVSCYAMQFQNPKEIGNISVARGDGIEIEGATRINATMGNDDNTYTKGFAIFDSSLYMHFDGDALAYKMKNTPPNKITSVYDEVSFFGGSDVENSVPYYVFEGGTKICRLPNDGGIEMYLISTETGGGGRQVILGNREGKWVKFIDTNDVRETYGVSRGNYFMPCQISGDTIIFPLGSCQDGKYANSEFRYTWDDSAKWFAVDYIK